VLVHSLLYYYTSDVRILMTVMEPTGSYFNPLVKLDISGSRVFIVDDEPSIRMILSSILDDESLFDADDKSEESNKP